MSARWAKGLFILLAAWACAYFRHIYPQLPSVVASHFDARGIANGWETKQTFFGVFAALTLLSAVFVFGLPKIIAAMPARWINLPNKEYWLAPEQRPATMEFLSVWLAWFGCAVYAVIIAAFHYAVLVNLSAPQGINPARLSFALACFGVFAIFWTIRLWVRFRRFPR